MSYLKFEKALMTNLQDSLPRELLRKMLYFTLKKIGLSWLGNNTKTRNSETL